MRTCEPQTDTQVTWTFVVAAPQPARLPRQLLLDQRLASLMGSLGLVTSTYPSAASTQSLRYRRKAARSRAARRDVDAHRLLLIGLDAGAHVVDVAQRLTNLAMTGAHVDQPQREQRNVLPNLIKCHGLVVGYQVKLVFSKPEVVLSQLCLAWH